MDNMNSLINSGGILSIIFISIIKEIISKFKEKEKRLNKNDIENAVQNVKAELIKEINDLKHNHSEFRLKSLESKNK